MYARVQPQPINAAAACCNHLLVRWIVLADRAGLAAVAKECIDAHVANCDVMRECSAELLAGLSPGTLVHLAIAQRDACHGAGAAAVHCGWCGQMRAARRTCCYCNRSL